MDIAKYPGAYDLPGQSAVVETDDATLYFGREVQQVYMPGLVDGASRDTGNTGYTSVLRAGLAMGKVAATGRLKPWNPLANDGTAVLYGFLPTTIDVSPNGVDRHKNIGHIFVGGRCRADQLLIAGAADRDVTGDVNFYALLYQMQCRFIIDSMVNVPAEGAYLSVNGAARTLLPSETGATVLVVTAHAVTLPAPTKLGMNFRIIGRAAVGFTVLTPSGKFLTLNDEVGTTITPQAGSQLGCVLDFECIETATGGVWLCRNQGTITNT